MMPGATFTAVERGDEGLWIEGNYDDTQLGQDLRVRARSGSAPGLSVGFVWLDSDPDDENTITSARVVEGSQITARMASVPGSQISAVRSAAMTDGLVVADPSDEENVRAVQRIAAARARLLAMI
jgi:phage head maturation protease